MIPFLLALSLSLLMFLYIYRRPSMHVLEQVVVFLFVGIVFQMILVYLMSDLNLLEGRYRIALFWGMVFIRTVSLPLLVLLIFNEMRRQTSRLTKGTVCSIGVLLLWGVTELLFRSQVLVPNAGFHNWWVPVFWTFLLLLILLLLRRFRKCLEKEIRPLCPNDST